MIWKIIEVHPSQCLGKLDGTISLEFRSVMIMWNLTRVGDYKSCVMQSTEIIACKSNSKTVGSKRRKEGPQKNG